MKVVALSLNPIGITSITWAKSHRRVNLDKFIVSITLKRSSDLLQPSS